MIEAVDVAKVYRRGRTEVRALAGVSLTVPKGEFLSVMGPSGSGKSTLLNLLGALDVAGSGSLRIDGRELSRMKDDELSAFRRERLGFVFQFFNLMPTMTALENVMLPGLLSGRGQVELRRRAETLLETVGLGGRTHHRPDELSGGEMQRVAVARALLMEPAVLLADEPTGNLDSRTGAEVLRMLREATRERGLTVVMVTHDLKAAEVGDRIVRLADGLIVGDERVVHEQAA
ncbi:putative ABC transport system ATP-binding protein [Archangium gephyra]|uniref:ABC transport system ATP-binding protein n=1 Tax=Archangium gephyra TaxID=48 RepID=A0AAC8TI47_9BACT|nr:ABC transporter ATP-binding protein [Archangium gephyra]AKJ06450.1 Lipoprotein releasing system ATP-binding protein LolD [Archangium gephyra]REG32238.1 putative ABC transport system ATP-binding protein [Archangium gephyra]